MAALTYILIAVWHQKICICHNLFEKLKKNKLIKNLKKNSCVGPEVTNSVHYILKEFSINLMPLNIEKLTCLCMLVVKHKINLWFNTKEEFTNRD